MDSKIEFLKEFNQEVEIITSDEINNIDSTAIPSSWGEIFRENDTKKRIDSLLNIWEQYVGKELRNTISYLSEFLVNVELLKKNNEYSILYTLLPSDADSDEEAYYYEGGNPLEKFNNEALEESWEKIPNSIRRFYENVHNGFFDYASESMGLVPLGSVTYFDDDEWGIIEELREPIQIDLKTTFGFSKNGMGGYVAIDYNNCTDDNATLWWVNKQPRYNINFWDVVDEWIVIGFQL